MPIHVEFSTVSRDSVVENGLCELSASVASGAASAAAPYDGVWTITPDENGYISIGPAVTAAAANPRRRVLLGVPRSFAVGKGDKVGFTAA